MVLIVGSLSNASVWMDLCVCALPGLTNSLSSIILRMSVMSMSGGTGVEQLPRSSWWNSPRSSYWSSLEIASASMCLPP